MALPSSLPRNSVESAPPLRSATIAPTGAGGRIDWRWALLVALAAALPFEVVQDLFGRSSFRVTNLKLQAGVTVVACLVGVTIALARRRRATESLRTAKSLSWRARPAWRERSSTSGRSSASVWRSRLAELVPGRGARSWTSPVAPALLFLGMGVLAALLAPSNRLDAVKHVTQLGVAFGLFAATYQVVTTRDRLAGLLWAVCLGAGVSALLGVAEAVGWWSVPGPGAFFKSAPTLVGGYLRVSATFPYATIAAMFFEMTTPLALALAATAPSRSGRLVALTIALLGVTAGVLTLTRASLVVLVLVFGLMLVAAWRWPAARPLARPAATALAWLVAFVTLLALTSSPVRTRLGTENDLGWYGASYEAPATLSLQSGEQRVVRVTARNTGEATWLAGGEHPFALEYRWLSADGEAQLAVSGGEIDLTGDVPPGQSVTLAVELPVRAPAGEYRIAWGMLQRDILSFRHRGVREAVTAVRVAPGLGDADAIAAPAVTGEADDTPTLPPTIGRATLWSVALRMFAERPLLGIGPDNFRRRYGLHLGLAEWATGIHANNLYLELLSGYGLLGTIAFGWLIVAVAGRLAVAARQLSRVETGADPLLSVAIGLSCSLLAFLVHGLVDYFLEFTPTYLLFGLTLGLISTVAQLAARRGRATPAVDSATAAEGGAA